MAEKKHEVILIFLSHQVNRSKQSFNVNDADGVLAEKVDLLFEKRKAVREAALSALQATLALRYCGDALEPRIETLAEGLLRVIKDMQLEPTIMAIRSAALASISLTVGYHTWFSKFSDPLQKVMANDIATTRTRVEAINTLAVTCFMSSVFDVDHEMPVTVATINTLKDYLFSERNLSPEITRAALQGCISNGSTLPCTVVHELLFLNHFNQVVDLMDEQHDIHLRMAAAKAVAVLVEWENDRNKLESEEEIEEDLGLVADKIQVLLDDRVRLNLKVDLKKQKKGLRSMIRYIEGEPVEEEVISVRSTPVVLTTWSQIYRMHRLRACLGEGFMNHLEENKNLMYMFDYFVDTSMPVIPTMTKQERRFSLSQASKVSTQRRFSLRSIREQEQVGYATE